jgi:hypothetical protein
MWGCSIKEIFVALVAVGTVLTQVGQTVTMPLFAEGMAKKGVPIFYTT